NEAMYAGLALEMAVSVIANDAQGCAADTGFFVAQFVYDFHSVSVFLRPARIHAHEHLRPVARFGASAAGLDSEERVAGILRPAEHRLKLKIVELPLKVA